MAQPELDEVNMLAQTGVHITHCPESNLKLAGGIFLVKQLLDNGINVFVLASRTASNNDLDLLAEMRIAALLANSHTKSSTAVTADTVLVMATINAIRTLGMRRTLTRYSLTRRQT